MSKYSSSTKATIKIAYDEHIPKMSKKNILNLTKGPSNWEDVFNNLKIMRKQRDAPVDKMGTEKCSDKSVSPKIFRFHTLVSLMLSSQTRDEVTHSAMLKLREHNLTVKNIIDTNTKVLEKLIYPVGFYKRKSEYIKKTCVILKEKYDEDIPQSIEELCLLPGVGKKMAYICMDVAWGRMEGIGVDTHVHRISNRLGWTIEPTKTPEQTRKALEDWLPKEYWKEVNILLVGFGQQRCLPIGPKCSTCLNQQICPFSLDPTNYSPKKLKSTKRSKQQSSASSSSAKKKL